jgi:hypothetical protein
MRATNRWVPHLVQIFTVLAVVGICFWVAYQRRLPPAPLARKIAEAERLSYQVVTRGQGPQFEIVGDERLIKIVSHAVLDPELEYDPRRTVSYGFRLRLMDEGRMLWQHDVLLDSRQSKDERLDDIWMRENAFTSRLDTELSDDRMLLVHLPEDALPGSTLEMTLLGEPDRALVRVYKYAERNEGAQRRALHRVDEAGDQSVFTHNTFTPWRLLTEEDKLDRLSHNFERMAPVGEAGMDFLSQSVFYTGFRSAVEALEIDSGLLLERHRGLVLNVLGPTSLRVELRPGAAPDPASIVDAGHRADVVRVRAVSEARGGHEQPDDSLRWELLVPSSSRPEIHSIEIPAGLHSLQFFTDAHTPVRLDVSGPPMSQFGAIPYVRHDDVDRRLVPDERRLVVFETGPDRLPAMAGIFVPGDPRARILRTDVRIVLAPDPPGVADLPPLANSLFQCDLVIEYLDAQQRVLAAERQTVEAPYTPFERMERSDRSVVSLSDSIGVRLIAPADTHLVKLTASRDVAIRFYRHLDGEDEYQAPYGEAPLARSAWRYAPRDRRQWFYTAPSNATSLVEADQRALLIAQVRLEPVDNRALSRVGGHAREQVNGPARGADGARRRSVPAPAIAVAPLGRPEQHVVFEPVLPRRFPDLLLRWPAGVATRLATGQVMRFRFHGATRPRLDYRIAAEHLGKTITVRVDGEPLTTMRFTTTRGYWSLPRVNPGNRDVEVVSDASAAELYLDRAPAPVAAGGPARFELIRRRTVHALGPEPLEVAVRKPPGKRVLVTMVVYAPWPEARADVEMRVVIGGGVPQRVTRVPFSRITVADRTLPLPEAAVPIPVTFADRHGRPVGYPRFITVPLGDDLVVGAHRIGFSVLGGERLWARFFVTHQTQMAGEQALQWSLHEDDAPFSGPAPSEDPADEPSDAPGGAPGDAPDHGPASGPTEHMAQ